MNKRFLINKRRCAHLFQEDSLFNGHLVTLAQYVTTILSLVFLFCWFGFQVDEKVNISIPCFTFSSFGFNLI